MNLQPVLGVISLALAHIEVMTPGLQGDLLLEEHIPGSEPPPVSRLTIEHDFGAVGCSLQAVCENKRRARFNTAQIIVVVVKRRNIEGRRRGGKPVTKLIGNELFRFEVGPSRQKIWRYARRKKVAIDTGGCSH